MSPLTPEWVTIISALSALSAIISSVITLLLGWLREWRANKSQKESEAAYLAMRLAVILEEFVVKCVYRSWHDEAVLNRGFAELDYCLPPLSSYPKDSDWKSLDLKLAGQVLSFQNEITAAAASCEFQGMCEGNKMASANETIVAGVNAWKLAQSLRKKYNLDAITIAHFDSLEIAHGKIEQHRKEFAERWRDCQLREDPAKP
jgi:hypothetical protein